MENKFIQFDVLNVKGSYLSQKSVLNLPNGMIIESLKIGGECPSVSLCFVPNINWADGQFKEIR